MKDNIELSYFTTIEFDGNSDDDDDSILPLAVKGISAKKGYIKRKHFIITSAEIKNISKTLKRGIDGKGAYILKDHGFKSKGIFGGGIKSVDLLVGRISDSEDKDGVVYYEGELSADEELAKKVKTGLVTSSSVGLRTESVYCSICGNDYGKCGHYLGEKYPKEKLQPEVQEFLKEMGGVPIAALVGKNITAMEQSIVLFPAIKGASVESFGVDFSEETEKFIEEMEKLKRTAAENLALEEEKQVKPSVESETFNKENVSYIDSEQSTMSEREVELSAEILGLKVELEKAGNDKTGLETQLSDKDASMVTLNEELTDVKGELTTNKALLKKYQDKEAADLAQENKEVEDAIVELAEKLEVKYDFEGMTLKGKQSILETLEASKITAQGSLPATGVELTDDEKREAEKAKIRKDIFGE